MGRYFCRECICFIYYASERFYKIIVRIMFFQELTDELIEKQSDDRSLNSSEFQNDDTNNTEDIKRKKSEIKLEIKL